MDLACARFGRLDVLVNNAGIGPISRFDALRVEDWDAMIDVNLRDALYGIAAALPVFGRQGSGHVVNVLSTAGVKTVPTMGVYAATKNATRTATEALRQEAGPHLRVTEVSPASSTRNSPAPSTTRRCGRPSRSASGNSPSGLTRLRGPSPSPSSSLRTSRSAASSCARRLRTDR